MTPALQVPLSFYAKRPGQEKRWRICILRLLDNTYFCSGGFFIYYILNNKAVILNPTFEFCFYWHTLITEFEKSWFFKEGILLLYSFLCIVDLQLNFFFKDLKKKSSSTTIPNHDYTWKYFAKYPGNGWNKKPNQTKVGLHIKN